jgi:hypothetical protein
MEYSPFLITFLLKWFRLDANQVDFAVCVGTAYSILVPPRAPATEGPPPKAEYDFFCRYLPAKEIIGLQALLDSVVRCLLPFSASSGWSRNGGSPPPPPQIPACGTTALGSYLG